MSKITKAFSTAILIYVPLLLLDYLYTLFSLTETGFYTSKLGIEFDHVMNEEMIATTFSINSILFKYYIILVIIIYLVILIRTLIINKSDLWTI